MPGRGGGGSEVGREEEEEAGGVKPSVPCQGIQISPPGSSLQTGE